MTAANRIRRTIRGGVLIGVPLLLLLASPGQVTPAAAGDPAESPNLLEHPMVDLALIPPSSDPDVAATTPPLLLVLAAASPSATTAWIDVLRRAELWTSIGRADVDLLIPGLDARWFVALGEDHFALIATTPRSTPGAGSTLVVTFSVDVGAERATITEVGRQTFDRAVETAGAADVDGFGSDELVLGMRPLFDADGGCGATSLNVLDAAAAPRRGIEVPGRLGPGVIGRFDGTAGDDLLVYVSSDCPLGGTVVTHLSMIRLADGTETRPLGQSLHLDPLAFPIPLRVDLDGHAPDEAIAITEAGLQVLDPGNAWRASLIAPPGSVPLVAGPTRQPQEPGVQVGLLDQSGSGSLVRARVGRAKDGGISWDRRSALESGAVDPVRWNILTTSILAAATNGRPSNAWLGDAVDAGCPDLVMPGAILPCGTDELRAGAGWLATRPVGAMPVGRLRELLVAAGLGWNPEVGLPEGPTPEAAGPPGWWRYGPSAPFALSEVRSNDLLYFRDFPRPAVTIEATTAKDGTTNLPAFTGVRQFVEVAPLAEGEDGGATSTDPLAALRHPVPEGSRTTVVRVAVPPGNESGRDGSFAPLKIGEFKGIDGQPTNRWSIQVVPINDWGEWGQPAGRVISRDATGPTVAVEAPFTSPVWPFHTQLEGRSEPGSMVRVDGIGDLEVDRRGRFRIDTQLAPWPQVFRVSATDGAGNVTVSEVSIIGGIDYRRFPWPGIVAAALLALVAARGLFGAGRRRATGIEPTRWSTGALDEAETPEIEELPPGSGLARG